MVPEGWIGYKVGELASDVRNSLVIGPFGSDLVQRDYRPFGVPVVFVRDIKRGRFDWKSGVFVDKAKAEKLRAHSVKSSDIVITKMGLPPGIAAVYPRGVPDGIITADIIRLRPDCHLVDSYFLCELLNCYAIQRQVYQRTAGQTRPKLTLFDYKTVSVLLPPLPEQKKIAAILSTWDEAIVTTEQLLANSRQQKKALAQQLLSGKKRLPGFEGEWRVVSLCGLAEINPSKNTEPRNGIVSFVPMSAVSEDAKLQDCETKTYKEVSKGFTSFKNNDTLVAKITPCFENGKGAYVNGLINGVGFGSTEFHVLRARENVDPVYLFLITNTHEFRRKGANNMQGSGGQRRVPTDFLKAYQVCLPASVAEQQAIARVLTLADQEISTLEQKHDRLKQEKKALMQQLLTGKRRVKLN